MTDELQKDENLPVTETAEQTAEGAADFLNAGNVPTEETAVEAAEEIVSVENTVEEAVEDVKDAVADEKEAAEAAEAIEGVKEAAEAVTETAAEAATEVKESADKVSGEVFSEEETELIISAEEDAESTDALAKEVVEEAAEEVKTGAGLLLDDVLAAEIGGKSEVLFDDEDDDIEEIAEKVDEVISEPPAEEKEYDLAAARESYEAEPPVIVFDQVQKEYIGQSQDNVALVDVSFSIKKGEFVFIVGPSGSGKSTMIRLMMREISPSGGKIYIAGKELAKLRRRHVSKFRRNIGIVFQDFRLLPDRNVYDNVAFAQRVIGAPRKQISKEIHKVLSLVGLTEKYKSFPNELSGGEQQRVAIARALVNNPMIILADEPTGNLDPENSYEIMSLLEEINRRGTTVVVVTHNREIVDQMQKRVVMLQNGTIVEDKKGGYDRG